MTSARAAVNALKNNNHKLVWIFARFYRRETGPSLAEMQNITTLHLQNPIQAPFLLFMSTIRFSQPRPLSAVMLAEASKIYRLNFRPSKRDCMGLL